MKINIKTVGDLIQELQKYPQDMLIFDMGGDLFEEVKIVEEIPLGDPANPKCKFVKGLELIWVMDYMMQIFHTIPFLFTI